MNVSVRASYTNGSGESRTSREPRAVGAEEVVADTPEVTQD
jgi:hypothetical protein